MTNWGNILQQVQQKSGLRVDSRYLASVSGGCINSCCLLGKDDQTVFIKTNRRERFSMFEAEAAGLESIAEAGVISVPAVLCTGQSGKVSFIAMQAIKMFGARPSSYRKFGQQLAALHRSHNTRFGGTVDNTIGLTPQKNPWSNSWFDFWRKYRLEFQLKLARDNQAPAALIENGFLLSESFEGLFDRPPTASCLHGDLWQGNWSFDVAGQPVIFDPAHYFGDRETDIAMTTLFGRAPADFYAAYEEVYPLNTGYSVRETFYNIYHVLNHFNLFGGAYASQADHMIQNVLSELH